MRVRLDLSVWAWVKWSEVKWNDVGWGGALCVWCGLCGVGVVLCVCVALSCRVVLSWAFVASECVIRNVVLMWYVV